MIHPRSGFSQITPGWKSPESGEIHRRPQYAGSLSTRLPRPAAEDVPGRPADLGLAAGMDCHWSLRARSFSGLCGADPVLRSGIHSMNEVKGRDSKLTVGIDARNPHIE